MHRSRSSGQGPIDSPALNPAIEARIDQLHAHGMVDMHFDMLMDLYDKRERADVLDADYLPDLEQGGVGILGAAIYIEDKYLPEQALRVALDQVARLYADEIEYLVELARRASAQRTGSCAYRCLRRL